MKELKLKVLNSLRVNEIHDWLRKDIYGNLTDKVNLTHINEILKDFEELKMYRHIRYIKLKYLK